MGKPTSRESASNVVRWVKDLLKYRKTTGLLAREDEKGEISHCCLGAGCEILGIPYEYEDSSSEALAKATGMRARGGEFRAMGLEMGDSLIRCNDETHSSDRTFENMKKVIVANYKSIFTPEVAEHLTVTWNGDLELKENH